MSIQSKVAAVRTMKWHLMSWNVELCYVYFLLF